VQKSQLLSFAAAAEMRMRGARILSQMIEVFGDDYAVEMVTTFQPTFLKRGR